MKRILALLLLAVMAFELTGCDLKHLRGQVDADLDDLKAYPVGDRYITAYNREDEITFKVAADPDTVYGDKLHYTWRVYLWNPYDEREFDPSFYLDEARDPDDYSSIEGWSDYTWFDGEHDSDTFSSSWFDGGFLWQGPYHEGYHFKISAFVSNPTDELTEGVEGTRKSTKRVDFFYTLKWPDPSQGSTPFEVFPVGPDSAMWERDEDGYMIPVTFKVDSRNAGGKVTYRWYSAVTDAEFWKDGKGGYRTNFEYGPAYLMGTGDTLVLDHSNANDYIYICVANDGKYNAYCYFHLYDWAKKDDWTDVDRARVNGIT